VQQRLHFSGAPLQIVPLPVALGRTFPSLEVEILTFFPLVEKHDVASLFFAALDDPFSSRMSMLSEACFFFLFPFFLRSLSFLLSLSLRYQRRELLSPRVARAPPSSVASADLCVGSPPPSRFMIFPPSSQPIVFVVSFPPIWVQKFALCEIKFHLRFTCPLFSAVVTRYLF